MNKKEWKIKSSKPIYKNPWIEVVEDIVVDSKGKEQLYGVTRIGTGTCVLPVDKEGHVYITNQFRYGRGCYSIECPGGAVDSGETPLEAAKRELKEELGIDTGEWQDLGYVNTLTSVVTHKEYLFLVTNIEDPGAVPENDEEDIELVKVSFAQAVDMAMHAEITHAPSVAAILKAQAYM